MQPLQVPAYKKNEEKESTKVDEKGDLRAEFTSYSSQQTKEKKKEFLKSVEGSFRPDKSRFSKISGEIDLNATTDADQKNKKTMKKQVYLVLAAFAYLTPFVKCAQLLGNFNLVSPPFVPQTYSTHTNFPGVVPALTQHQDIAHPAVVENSKAESQLPPGLLNPFYKNPVIASALASESWFANKEFPVHHREADNISREEIYKIISRLRN
ncbi:uncharacterized protein LOC130894961 [Diorhabda carinulata]|uniref:uncharacterized protein LOC130894961 n=1 Tax=Diorhabda carinulata TaxID=1163345 RepID=UPI0025A057F7|nr:uncharacterized protein LOC130894961 [Diorhabda carinulata]